MVDLIDASSISASKVVFRLACDDLPDSARFCALFNSLYSRQVGRDYYRWQFFDTPFASYLAMALTDCGDLAGCYGFHVTDLAPTGRRVGWAVDIMVAPKYQGTGLFRMLAHYAASQVSAHAPVALCVMANQRAYHAHVYGLGWQRINTLTNFACDTAIHAARQRTVVDIMSVDGAWVSNSWLPHSIGEAWGVRGAPLAFNGRSMSYMRWRFGRSPWYRYAQFVVKRNGSPFAYLVLKVFRDPRTGDSSGDIVDLLWSEDDDAALYNVLRFALHHFHLEGVRQANIWLQTNTVLDEVGRRLGFVDTAQRRFFCGRILDERYDCLADSGRWFVTMADSEIY